MIESLYTIITCHKEVDSAFASITYVENDFLMTFRQNDARKRAGQINLCALALLGAKGEARNEVRKGDQSSSLEIVARWKFMSARASNGLLTLNGWPFRAFLSGL